MSLAQPGPRVGLPQGARPAGWEPLLLAGGLTAYNVALNGVPFPGWSYIPANLALAGTVAYWAHRRWGLGAHALGLSRSCVRPGLRAGAVVAAATGAALLAAPRVEAAHPLLADRRASGVSGPAVAYQALLRIPLGTALTEELLFRGVLPAACRPGTGEAGAVLLSSAAFGAWHVGPALALLRQNRIELSPLGTAAAVGATVAAAAVAGVGFSLLRRWGGGLLAPVLAHAAFNGLSLWAASRFQRRDRGAC